MIPPAPPPSVPTIVPSVRRQLACMTYEAVLLFGVVMVAGLLYGTAMQQRHAMQGSTGLQAFLFVVLGVYFVGFWSASGQTLAMKTWHIRLQSAGGGPPSRPRAIARYLLSWLWFVPALACAHLAGVNSVAGFGTIVTAGMVAYAVLARLRPDRQWLHDVICGTVLVDSRPRPASPAQSVA